MYESIKSYFDFPKKKSNLCSFISKKLCSEKDRSKLSCRKLPTSYYEESGIKVSKSTIHNILKNEMRLHYLKSTLKINYLIEEIGLLNYMCFIKIFTRCIKVGFSPNFIDESKIDLHNNHFKAWGFKHEELYFGNSSKEKRNLLLAVRNNQIYSYKIIIENTTAGVFIDFLKEVINKIMKDKSNKYFIIF